LVQENHSDFLHTKSLILLCAKKVILFLAILLWREINKKIFIVCKL
jgi:hypothetical protein